MDSLKGPKGDAFTYSDFTQEQLENLKGDKGEPGNALVTKNAAEVGQTIRVSAVDETGQPTEWEAVDGEKPWRKINEITLTEETPTIDITQDSDGKIFALTEIYVYVDIVKPESLAFATQCKLQIWVGETYRTISNNLILSGKERYLSFLTRLIPGCSAFIEQGGFEYNYNWILSQRVSMHPKYIKIVDYNVQAITKIRLCANDNNVNYTFGGIGTKVYVWGR